MARFRRRAGVDDADADHLARSRRQRGQKKKGAGTRARSLAITGPERRQRRTDRIALGGPLGHLVGPGLVSGPGIGAVAARLRRRSSSRAALRTMPNSHARASRGGRRSVSACGRRARTPLRSRLQPPRRPGGGSRRRRRRHPAIRGTARRSRTRGRRLPGTVAVVAVTPSLRRSLESITTRARFFGPRCRVRCCRCRVVPRAGAGRRPPAKQDRTRGRRSTSATRPSCLTRSASARRCRHTEGARLSMRFRVQYRTEDGTGRTSRTPTPAGGPSAPRAACRSSTAGASRSPSAPRRSRCGAW